MFDTETIDATEYRMAYNPAFVARVKAKRHRAEMEAKAKALAEKRWEEQRLQTEARLKLAELRQHRLSMQQAKEQRKIDAANLVITDSMETREIIYTVSAAYSVTEADIFGNSRKEHIIEARHAAMWEVHKRKPHLSANQIGKIFRRDHTSILSALRKMEARSTQHGEG